ncbi:hypothetical protein B9Z55_026321 [Caenorhabditis nigoni]|uniref:Uncharacterized protein n=1 Tax=Caenorhabditis nigoni TaxID=1611254 RepID=A0A2G5T2Y1_9PELO|nr:hypothetical protein B9Z55_026321 [Caenorhabditis nigoni]
MISKWTMRPRARVTKGYTRRGRPSKKDPAPAAVDVVDAPVNAPAVEAIRAPKTIRPENGAPETVQVMRRAARKAIQQKEPLEEGMDEYQKLLQEDRDHHSECPIFEDPEIDTLTVVNLYNLNKRSKEMPQEVEQDGQA